MIRDSSEALEGKMNNFEGRPVFEESAYFALEAGSSALPVAVDLVDLVLVILLGNVGAPSKSEES